MKILHILDHSIPLHSGYTFRTRAILQQQHALGWETDHITSPKHYGSAGLEETVDDLHFFRTPPAEGRLARLPILNQLAVSKALARRLDAIIESVKPDILHAHSPALNGLAAIKVGARHRLPVVYEVRAFWEDAAVDHGTSREWGPRYRATRALETHVLKRADAVTTICEGLRSDIVARGIPAGKVTVIPNAVDAERFSTDLPRDPELVHQLGLEGAAVVGFIGSFYAYEGLDLLIEALPAVLSVRKDVKLLLVGGGPQEERLRARAKELGVSDRVVFTGRVPHEHVDRYYALVDVFAYPRHPMRLTELVTPLKPLEAMAQGRILIASDVGGHKELIRDGETGMLFRAGDVKALAEGLLSLLENQETWPAMRAAGRAFVETERNWPVSVARYRPIYEALSGARK
ncbi:MAG: glycosyltransferase, exosortase A system-associated [Chromatiales bacterium]|nr:glycosyltransferase, exosortase A system-associated [Chromatiales bacterium]